MFILPSLQVGAVNIKISSIILMESNEEKNYSTPSVKSIDIKVNTMICTSPGSEPGGNEKPGDIDI